MDFKAPDGVVYGSYLGVLNRADLPDSNVRSNDLEAHENGTRVPSPRVIWERSQQMGIDPCELWKFADHGEVIPSVPVGQYGRLSLRGLRIARGLTLAELAKQVGVSRQCLHQWETGARQPRFLTIWRLSRALGVPTGHLWRWV